MKFLKNIITNTFCTFSVLSFLIGILCKVNVIGDMPYSKTIFTLLLMSVSTTIVVGVRAIVVPDLDKWNCLVDLFGCGVVVFLIGYFVGWLEMSMPYFLMIVSIVLVVYVLVWFVTWLQSKHDEEDLNRLLTKQSHEQGKQKK